MADPNVIMHEENSREQDELELRVLLDDPSISQDCKDQAAYEFQMSKDSKTYECRVRSK